MGLCAGSSLEASADLSDRGERPVVDASNAGSGDFLRMIRKIGAPR